MKNINTSSNLVVRPRLGVSGCLLGQEVRFDGGHKRDRFLTESVAKVADFVPFCPETEIGLPTPRPSLRLIGQGRRIITPKNQTEQTGAMNRYAQTKVASLADNKLSGVILKSKSPSCGMERVRVYPEQGQGAPRKDGRGIFASALMEAYPDLPVEEEGRLRDPILRENFFERVFANARLQHFFAGDWAYKDLIEFHAREKLLLMAHSDYRPVGRLIARGRHLPRPELEGEYRTLFMRALGPKTTVGKHVNVMQHAAGYFKDLDAGSRREVHELIGAYAKKLIPLVAPLTLVRHHVGKLQLSWLQAQSYFKPCPQSLMLRNHA